MSAVIRPLGGLKEYIGGQTSTSVEAGRSIRQVLRELGINPDLVAMALVNDRPADKDHVLQDGDELKLLAVIGGG